MSLLDLAKGVEIYRSTDAQVSVFEGTISHGSIPVVVKEQLHSSLLEANSAIQEALSQVKLQHENICHIYGCYLEAAEAQIKSVLVIERMDHDLFQEINQRKAAGQPWEESELITFLKDLTSALAFAQENGISHRDIKPQNIFVKENKVKLGDFGSASRSAVTDLMARTIQGSPFFLSPELKIEFRRSLTGAKTEVLYDSFKSDMYSLGVTFVYLANLEPPLELGYLNNLEAETRAALEKLNVSNAFKDVLNKMLVVDPRERIGFKELRKMLELPDSSYVVEQSQVMQQSHESVSIGLPNASQHQETEPKPSKEPIEVKCVDTCLQCTQPILDSTWTHNVPTHLLNYQRYFPQLCSENCLVAFNVWSTVSTVDQCVNCKSSLSFEPVKLDCLHMVCDKDCFFTYLRTISANFTVPASRGCPACCAPISKTCIDTTFGNDVFPAMALSILEMLCAECRKRDAVYKFKHCNHRFCASCLKKKPKFYSNCPKCE